MPHWRAAVAPLALLGCCPAAQAADPGETGPLLRVAWIEQAPLDPFAYGWMEDEGRAILRRLGLRLRLRRREPGDDTPRELRVVLLDRFASDKRSVMGAVLLPLDAAGDGRMWIFQQAVRSLTSVGECGIAAVRRQGTVLGRVLAHEVVHALAPTLGHADEGLMARTLSTADLALPISIDAATLAAVRGASAGLAGRDVLEH